jgi:hypothetical protein
MQYNHVISQLIEHPWLQQITDLGDYIQPVGDTHNEMPVGRSVAHINTYIQQ